MDERLLLATALVHATSGGALVAVDVDGHRTTVGRHPSADVDPCRWRSAVADLVRVHGPAGLDGLTFGDLGGSLAPAPSGGFVDRAEPDRRWFVASLPPYLAVDVLEQVDLGALPADAVEAVVRPDPVLGVTVIGVSVRGPGDVDTLAADIAGALAVAELCVSLPVAEG